MRYEQAFAITERLDNLLALIGLGTHSSPSIAQKLGVSEQTIYRDVVFLKRRGHPIRAVRLSASWAYQLSSAAAAKRQRKAARRK